MAIITDYTSTDYNSYITAAESDLIAEQYAVYYPSVNWAGLSDEAKDAWLLNTAREANTEWGYEGQLNSKVTSTNSGGMQWPRRGATHSNGLSVDETEVPNGIKEFQVVRALEYLSNPALISTGADKGAIKKQKLDVLEQEFYEPSTTSGTKTKPSSMQSYKLIEPYLTAGSMLGSTKAVVRA